MKGLTKPNKQLEHQQERDKLKQKLCKDNGVMLIIIPYWIKNKEKFIESILFSS